MELDREYRYISFSRPKGHIDACMLRVAVSGENALTLQVGFQRRPTEQYGVTKHNEAHFFTSIIFLCVSFLRFVVSYYWEWLFFSFGNRFLNRTD